MRGCSRNAATDGKVEAPRQQHQHLAEGDQHQKYALLQHVEHVGGTQEARIAHLEHHHADDEDDGKRPERQKFRQGVGARRRSGSGLGSVLGHWISSFGVSPKA